MDKRTQALCSFLNASVSGYHAVAYVADLLEKQGYCRLSESQPWQLEAGGRYYFTRNGSSLLAFRVPQKAAKGFMLTASHCDRPCLKVKENGELKGNYTRLAVERYGGMLMYTWLDRPLSVAGRVLVETENGAESKLVNIDRDLLLIPNVAIHMNRQANDGMKWNPATDLIPLVGGKEAVGKLWQAVEEEAGGRILGHDLILYCRQQATVWGVEDEYISAQGLDDLSCVWACTQGFLQAEESESIPVLCILDNEEVGSRSQQGADSDLLRVSLTRICDALDLNLPQLLRNSFMLSADNGHAIHPNHPEYADPTNAPVVNNGVVLKFNSSLSYVTDGVAAAIFRKVCGKAGVPVQNYYNRADIPGGSTLGNVALTHLSLQAADIGLPQLAMHSCYETAGVKDAIWLEEAATAYYSSTLEKNEEGFVLK